MLTISERYKLQIETWVYYLSSMELVTLATIITKLIFSEALKEGGKTLGKGVSEQVARLVTAIREKFKAVGTEGILTRVQMEFCKRCFRR